METTESNTAIVIPQIEIQTQPQQPQAQEQQKISVNEQYAKAKAEAEVKEMSSIIQSPQKLLNAKLGEKIGREIETSEAVEKKVASTTQILVDKGLKEQKNKAIAGVINSENEALEADFNKNKDEYLYHGINHKVDKKWKNRLLLTINDFWFVIWAIVSCFTIVPVSTYLGRIKALNGLTKAVAIIVGISLGLGCLGGLVFLALSLFGVINIK